MKQSVTHRAGRSLIFWSAALIVFSSTAAYAQVSANVEFSNISPLDPHPVTYVWTGKKGPITDPTHFYTYYYTGTVDPDARVAKEVKIERIPVTQEEWDANYKWVILKLKYYYQITKSMPLTALSEMSGEPVPSTAQGIGMPSLPSMPSMSGAQPMGSMPGTSAPGQPPGRGLPPTQPGVPPGMTSNYYGSPNMQMPSMMGPEGMASFGAPAPTFDSQTAAEWTFFYDQLVLWQYYCGRQILDKESELVDPMGAPTTDQAGNPVPNQPAAAGRTGGAMSSSAMSPMPAGPNSISQNPEISMVDLASAMQPGDAGKETLEAMRRRTRMDQGPGANQPQMMGQGGMYSMGGPGGAYSAGPREFTPQAPAGGAQAQTGALRETFNPVDDYLNPDRILAYRIKYQQAADTHESELYKSFLAMITDIEQRELNQEQYDKWIDGRHRELISFADEWRKAEDGSIFMVDGTLFVVTDKPADTIPVNAINVIKSARLTPQDLLNEDGSVKKPAVQ